MEIENEQFIKNKQLVVIEKIKKNILKKLYICLNILNENKDDIKDISMLLACVYTIKKYNLISDDELDNTLGKNYIYKVFKKKRDVLNELTKTQKVQIGGLFFGLLFLGVLYLAVNKVESHLGISENALSIKSIISSHRNARDISLAEKSKYASRYYRPQHTTNPSEEESLNDKVMNIYQFNALYRLAIANTEGQCVFNSDLNAYPFEEATENFKVGAYSSMLLTNNTSQQGQIPLRNTNFLYAAGLEKYRKNTNLPSDFVFTWDYVNEIIQPQLGKLFDEYVKLFPSFTGVVVFSAGISLANQSGHQINLLVRRNNIGEVKYAVIDANSISDFLGDELNDELDVIAMSKDIGFLVAQPGFFLDKNNEETHIITENPLEYISNRYKYNVNLFKLGIDDIQAFDPVTELPIVKLTGSNLDKIIGTKGALDKFTKTLDGYKKESQEEYEKQVGVHKEKPLFKQYVNTGIDNVKIMKERTSETYDVPEGIFSEVDKMLQPLKSTNVQQFKSTNEQQFKSTQVAKDNIPKTSENRFSSFMTTDEDDAAETAEAETKQQQKEKQTKYKRRKNKGRQYTERQRQREGNDAAQNAADNYFPTREKIYAENPISNWGNTARLNREKAGLVNLVEDPEDFVINAGGSNRSVKRKKNKNKTRKNKSKGKRRNKSKTRRRNKLKK